MIEEQRRALSELHLESALTKEHVWNAPPVHVSELHAEAQRMISKGLTEARNSSGPSPIGVVLNGRSGAGKTHVLGWVRQRMQREGGYFFLTNLGDSGRFWPNVAEALRKGLDQDGEDGESQLVTFLRRLSSAAGLPTALEAAVAGDVPVSPEDLAVFVDAVVRLDRRAGRECQDAVRALVLIASSEPRKSAVGFDYLTSSDEMSPEDRTRWGFRSRSQPPRRVVEEVSTLLALTGPSVIAVDQIDSLVALSNRSTTQIGRVADEKGVEAQIAEFTDGLMLLREGTRRTLTVLACIPQSWELIRRKAVNTVLDRFRETPPLSRIPDAAIGRELVEARFVKTFERVGFTPPYPTWPVAPSAFADVTEYTPRQLLTRIDTHVESCLATGRVRELVSFAEVSRSGEVIADPPPPSAVDLAPLDARFAELTRAADPAAALDPDQEDRVVPPLLHAGLTAWIAERATAHQFWSVDPPSTAKQPPLHARLRQTVDEELEDEDHWCFRAIGSTAPRAALSRLTKARNAAGAGRTLVLVRNAEWSQGKQTQEVLAEVVAAGGVSVPITDDDLRTFGALRQMLQEREPGLHDWLTARRPASGSELLGTVLPHSPAPPDPEVPDPEARDPVVPDPEVRDPEVPDRAEPSDVPAAPRFASSGASPRSGPVVPVGEVTADHTVLHVALESLRKHVVIFAGSGSGKTVLIRRLVEECALLGVSSIVLDPNNDLARLGDAWPRTPGGWRDGDAAKAGEYLAETDVVIWTPGRASGRPLVFRPLPDFAGMADDPDEFEFAVRAAVATLAPRVRADGPTERASRARAVLTDALKHYAKTGGRSLAGLVDVLAELPEGVSELASARNLAPSLAETLRAAMVNDPLFGGTGHPVDPGVLLTPAPGRRARVSVVNLEALSSLEEKQGFVNQLQMELFAWVKRNPAGDRPLGGLLVMDEAQDLAPSSGRSASTESSIRLASQARKYGLGLVLATQAPKALHNRIAGNATTQFFGRLNSPAHLEAARDLARAKGSSLPDLGRLGTGQFYVTGDDVSFQKVRSPLCLSHHPASPLTQEEVLERTR
ncbi:ATP-binding protein [Umezawaea beigongshangensis]|uniref:ATP-binding protein n=1 Tax=Umezawaea beigongshangensis TaxID=2780383 RepID=UPI0018F16781|nr:ATP-binding protein [Umezawaea beigongshangensis]